MKKTLLALFAFVSISASAQWVEHTPGLPANHYVNYLSVPTANAVWGTTLDASSQTAPPTNQFVRSVDGGTTWTVGTLTGVPTSEQVSNIHALSADTAYISTYDAVAGAGGGVYVTFDGGSTWTKQATAAYTAGSSFPNIVYFYDNNNGVTMGDPLGGYFEIYTTSDGGTNWTRIATDSIPAELAGEYGLTNVYDAVGDTLWFGTNLGRIYRSTNMGRSWTVSTTGLTSIGDVAFSTSTYGIIREGGSSNVKKTTDGGLTWTNLLFNGTIFSYDIADVPGTPGMFVSVGDDGSGGGVFGSSYSLDSGNTWVDLDTLIHTSVEFFNLSSGWSGGISNGTAGGMFEWTGATVSATTIAASTSFAVYPNPANEVLNVRSASQVSLIEVMDLNGKVLKSQSFNAPIDVKELSSGIYLIKVTSADNVSVERFVKN